MSEQPTVSGLELSDILALIRSVQQSAYLIPLADAQAVAAEISRTDGLMPLFDPTGYQAIAGKIAGNRELVDAFIVYRRALEKVGEQIRQGRYT